MPDLKYGEPQDVGNYRPILMQPKLSKVFEIFVLDKINPLFRQFIIEVLAWFLCRNFNCANSSIALMLFIGCSQPQKSGLTYRLQLGFTQVKLLHSPCKAEGGGGLCHHFPNGLRATFPIAGYALD